jgi:hypothetical protein
VFDTGTGLATKASAASVTTISNQIGSYNPSTITIGALVTNLTATYSLTLDVGGNIAGLVFSNNGSTAALKILGNVVVDGSLTTGKFAARSVDTTVLAINGVDIINIIEGSATGPAFVQGADFSFTAATVGTAFSTGATMSFDVRVGKVLIDAAVQLSTAQYPVEFELALQLWIDGSMVKQTRCAAQTYTYKESDLTYHTFWSVAGTYALSHYAVLGVGSRGILLKVVASSAIRNVGDGYSTTLTISGSTPNERVWESRR